VIRAIVVNWNGGTRTIAALESLLANPASGHDLEVVLVDNGSTDGIAERVEHELPDVRVMRNATNLGFAGGVNTALADLAGVEAVALLNNDAVVTPGWLDPLVASLEAATDVGAACPKILLADQYLDIEITMRHETRSRAHDLRIVVGGGHRVDGTSSGSRLSIHAPLTAAPAAAVSTIAARAVGRWRKARTVATASVPSATIANSTQRRSCVSSLTATTEPAPMTTSRIPSARTSAFTPGRLASGPIHAPPTRRGAASIASPIAARTWPALLIMRRSVARSTSERTRRRWYR
jgi:hypothetical protein